MSALPFKIASLLPLFVLFAPIKSAYSAVSPSHVFMKSDEKMIQLSGYWDFFPSDRLDCSDLKADPELQLYMKPADGWYIPSQKDKYCGTGWLRLKITLEKKSENCYALYLPVHARGMQVFLNEKLLYSTREVNEKGETPQIAGKPVLIPIPSSLLQKENDISLRSASLNYRNTFSTDDLFFGLYDSVYEKSLQLQSRWLLQIFTLGFMAVFFLVLFLFRAKEKYYLFFSLYCVSLSLWIAGYNGLIFSLYDNQILYYITTYLCAIVSPIWMILFVFSYFGLPRTKTLISSIIVFSLIAIAFSFELAFTGGIFFFNKYIYEVFMMCIGLLSLYSIYINIIEIKRKFVFATIIFIGQLILIFSFFISIFSFLSLLPLKPLLGEGFFGLSIMFSLALALRYSHVFADLEQAHADLLVLDKMKDDFLATTSHELRTPLHGIMGLSESMSKGELGPVNDDQKENLEIIHGSAAHLTELVNEILDFSKPRAGKADLFLEKTRVEDIAATVVSLMKQSASAKGIELVLEMNSSPEIIADRNRLRQVLINLVGNAIKFTDKGSVRVIVESAEKGGAHITVRDTGQGISREDLTRIWNPFEQAEDPNTRRRGGTGLGLSITRHLVELHGGTISAESEPGKGTAFFVELPSEPPTKGIQRALPLTAEKKQYPQIQRGITPSVAENIDRSYSMQRKTAPAKLLAVDDDPVNLRVIEQFCRVMQYDIHTASSGPDALKILSERDIDLVLLDLMLPGISGFEVCQKIRADERLKNVPVIMITARDTTGDLVKSFATGANDYITKPFNREELFVRIENQLVIKQMLDIEKSIVNGLRQEKDAITNLYQRSQDLKESTLQMLEWERIVREDMNIAHSFQMKLMTHAKNIQGLESSVWYQPLLKLGGDIYDIFELQRGLVRIFLADATGHGITASLNTVKILSEYAIVKTTLPTPEALMRFLNKRFCTLYNEYRIIFTCAIVDIDIATGNLTISTAGHPECFLVNSEKVMPVKSQGPIIGFTESLKHESVRYFLKKGDVFLLYTDGLVDLIRNQHGAFNDPDFDAWEKLESRISEIDPELALDEIIAQILQPPAEKRLSRNLAEDDITLIALRLT